MRFTKQDAVTFGLGALAAAGLVLGEALIEFSEETFTNLTTWLRGLAAGMLTALGRYLVTSLRGNE